MSHSRKSILAGALLCLASAGSLLAQEGKDIVEINLFGGIQGWDTKQATQFSGAPLGVKMVTGGVMGLRVDENWWRYVGLEESSVLFGDQNVRYTNVPGVYGNTTSFGARTRQFTVGPILYLTPPESRFRPFLTVQAGLNWFGPIQKAKDQAGDPNNPLFGAAGPIALGSSWKQAFNYGIGIIQYGGGIKYKMTDRFGLRVDLRGNVIQTPTFRLPRSGPDTGITIAQGGAIPGYQATAGFTLYLGKGAPPLTHVFTVPAAIDGPAALCPGEKATFKLPVTDNFGNHTPKYKWTVNGQDQNTNAPELTVTAPDSGPLNVAAHVEPDASSYTKPELRANKKTPAMPADRTLEVHMKEYKAPTLACSANPTGFEVGGTSAVTGNATSSECSGQLTYSWSASEGSIEGNSNATYNSQGVSVEPGASKNVTVNGKVTDAKGASANCEVALSVTKPAPPPPPPPVEKKATQLDDIVFPSGSSRVNNCAKRILEDLYKQMAADPDSTVVLIGHEDSREARHHGTKRHPRHIDEERALNSAAVLTAGTGTCQKLELSRVKLDWTGTTNDPNSEFKTRTCEASVRERKGQAAGTDSDAKYRRVEIWLVPNGAPMPPAAAGAKPAPEQAVKAKGCPK